MKSYTKNELVSIIEGLESEKQKIQDEISKLTEKRRHTKLLDFQSKRTIDENLRFLLNQTTCYNYTIMMLNLYEDSLHTDYNLIEEDELIHCEIEAETGDGISKLIVFCHKCFVEHTIVKRDIRRLQIEAENGVLPSAYILFGYNRFFADQSDK